MRKRRKNGYLAREARNGRLFVLPWALGFVLFFVMPMVQSVWYSLCRLTLDGNGYVTRFIGFTHYQDAFLSDLEFPRALLESIGGMLVTTPVVVILSLFLALLINQKFRLRTLARAIFFLPVVVASSVAMDMIGGDSIARAMKEGSQALNVFSTSGLEIVLREYGMDAATVTSVTGFIGGVFDLLWKCGVQVLLFLAGLQSINGSLYEAASVEGATGWEKFWKITFPMITPVILLCVIYSVIDSFTDYGNDMVQLIYSRGLTQMKYDAASALALIYSACVAAVVGIVFLGIRKRIFYQVD